MAGDLNDLADPEDRLCEALAAYFEAGHNGQAPERQDWLAPSPDVADRLVNFLDDEDRLLRLTEPLRAAAAPAHADRALHDFGDYDVFEEIARGGMGVVYRARQRSLNRPVALKVL